MNTNNWDKLAKTTFDTTNADNIHPSSLDNMLIAHPVICSMITSYFGPSYEIEALDFGCGTGGFAKVLSERNVRVVGVDPSQSMIDIARSRNIPNSTFIQGDVHSLEQLSSFALIVSVMVFQFIEDIDHAIKCLCSHLKEDGLIVFAVHNDKYIDEALLRGYKFRKTTDGNHLEIAFDYDVAIPIFKRSIVDYQRLFSEQSMQEFKIVEPPFSKEYLDMLSTKSLEPTEVPKYSILAFRR